MYSEKIEKFWHSPSLELAEKIFAEDVTYTFQDLHVKGRKDVVNHLLEIHGKI